MSIIYYDDKENVSAIVLWHWLGIVPLVFPGPVLNNLLRSLTRATMVPQHPPETHTNLLRSAAEESRTAGHVAVIFS